MNYDKVRRVNVYRDDDRCDCTNNGVTAPNRAHGKDFYLIQDIEDRVHIPEGGVGLVLERRTIGGREYLSCKPLEVIDNGKWGMAGGNFIYSCDSRFPSDYPISVHDRVED